MKPYIIIPVFNPDNKLYSIVKELNEHHLMVIVVNDGSTNHPTKLLQKVKHLPNSQVLVHETNRGKGAAIKTAVQFILSECKDCSGIVTADADGQHAVADILKVVSSLNLHSKGLVLGSRQFNLPDVPVRSRFGNKLTSIIFRFSTGVVCRDTQTGLRGIPIQYADMCLSIEGERYEYEMNMLLEFSKQAIPFIEVPIETIYMDGNQRSHFHPIKDSYQIYKKILKYSLSALFSAGIDLSVFSLVYMFLFVASPNRILIATIIARCISGIVNFIVNKQWVFNDKSHIRYQIMFYSLLFAGQLFFSGFMVLQLSRLSIPVFIGKVFVDLTLFFINYSIQRTIIFSNKHKGGIVL